MLDHDNFHLIFQGKVNLLVMFCVFYCLWYTFNPYIGSSFSLFSYFRD